MECVNQKIEYFFVLRKCRKSILERYPGCQSLRASKEEERGKGNAKFSLRNYNAITLVGLDDGCLTDIISSPKTNKQTNSVNHESS